MTRYVLIAGDGYGCHVESGLQYVTRCGRVFNPEQVTREVYEGADTPDHRHADLCFDCHTVANGGEISPQRRERHFSRGGTA